MKIEKQTHTFKVVGDCEIRADAYRRPDDEIRPAVVGIHGGAFVMGRRDDLDANYLESRLAGRYVLVSIDYRLAPETKLPEIVKDVRDAIRWTREQGPELFRIDPARLAVVGHSAGGYLALTCGNCVEPRPRAVVSFYGYGDIAGQWVNRPYPLYCELPAVSEEEAYAGVGESPISRTERGDERRGAFYLYCRQRGLFAKAVSGHDPAEDPEALAPLCPVRHIGPDYPPTLLLHGDADTDVPYEQSVRMAEALARAGVEHELITIPGGPHGFDHQWRDSPVVAKALRRVSQFLEQHLG